MEGLELIETQDFYNLLQESSLQYSNLSDINYLLIIDARSKSDYNEGHVITAKRAPKDKKGDFMIPYDAELECKKKIVIYDGHTKSLTENDSPALECGRLYWKMGSRNKIKILSGGYEEFSALYPFLRTQKIIYTPMELDEILPYPIEIIQGSLYMGNWRQGNSVSLHKDLKIHARIVVCVEESHVGVPGPTMLHLQIEGKDSDNIILKCLGDACSFIESHFEETKKVLIFDHLAISRAPTICMALLMYRNKWTLEEAYNYMCKCSPVVRPSREFIRQLSSLEEDIFGEKKTNIEDPFF